jgi:hypothetical protein
VSLAWLDAAALGDFNKVVVFSDWCGVVPDVALKVVFEARV